MSTAANISRIRGLDTGLSTTGDEVRLGKREVYIHYPNGMGQTKLKLPEEAAEGTVRNLNTVRKLTEMAGIQSADIPGHGWSLVRSTEVQGCVYDLYHQWSVSRPIIL